MKEVRRKYDEEFKKNAVKLTYGSNKSVPEIAEDLGIGSNVLYRWRQRYTVEGNLTERAAIEQELRATQRELAEVKLERDMLKKAAAYFASLHK
jgi:Transposase and inactivated derivatives